VTGEHFPPRKGEILERAGVEILALPEKDGHISIRELLSRLGRRGITSLLLEGGAETYGTFLKEGQVDKLLVFIAPCLLGGRKAVGMVGGMGVARVAEAVRLKEMKVKTIGGDILVEAYPEK
jgi:diaminohydroxyphosphoribosylaminopyrimidine deaminase/5-amino-6-(5-phosphoribosylamino)uracil reductase